MARPTETEMLGHIEACQKDACKVYNCEKKDIITKVLKGGYISIRLKNAAQKERQN